MGIAIVVVILHDLRRKCLDGQNVAGVPRLRPDWNAAAGNRRPWLRQRDAGFGPRWWDRHSGAGIVWVVIEVPLFGRRQQIYDLRTRVEPGKAGKVIRGQTLDLGGWSVGGIVGNRYLAVDLAAVRPPYFVVRVFGQFILEVAHENSELS